MKKVLIALVAVACTVSAFGQGITFNNNVAGQVVAPIFGPNPGDLTLAINGQPSSVVTNTGTPNPYPAGTTEYLGAALTGRGYYAQLWGAKDVGAPGLDGEVLQPLLSSGTNLILVFRTINRFYGALQTVPQTAVVPDTVVNDYVMVQMRVWENRGETLRSWDAVINDADLTILRGESNPFRIQLVSGSANIRGLESFNIHQAIPEPSVIAMGVLGLGALVLLRRRKN